MDSEQKPEEVQKPTGPLSITVATKCGHRTLRVDPVTKKFVKSLPKKASTAEIVKITRDFLSQKLEGDGNGGLKHTSKSRFMQQVEVMHEHIMNSRGTRDPKMVMAAASAFKIIAERAYGPARDQDIDAFASGLKIVFVTPPDLPNQGEVQEKEKLTPSFIDAEIVKTN